MAEANRAFALPLVIMFQAELQSYIHKLRLRFVIADFEFK